MKLGIAMKAEMCPSDVILMEELAYIKRRKRSEEEKWRERRGKNESEARGGRGEKSERKASHTAIQSYTNVQSYTTILTCSTSQHIRFYQYLLLHNMVVRSPTDDIWDNTNMHVTKKLARHNESSCLNDH